MHSTTGALEGGEVGQLLDRFDERVQPLHVSPVADPVIRQTVAEQSQWVNRTRGVCDIALWHTAEKRASHNSPQGLEVAVLDPLAQRSDGSSGVGAARATQTVIVQSAELVVVQAAAKCSSSQECDIA